MSDAGRLREAFAHSVMLAPDASTPNLIDLALALATAAGVPGLDLRPNAADIYGRIAGPEHHVFVLVDGLGMNQVERLPRDAWLRRHLASELCTVFVSSTAPALTSLATGLWPGGHAVTAWWTYLPEPGIVATILPFVAGPDGIPIAPRHAVDAFPARSLLVSASRDVAVIQPKKITGSVYSSYFAGGRAQFGYSSLDDAVDLVRARISASRQPTYTYLYIPQVDAASHDYGPESTQTALAAGAVDAALARLARDVDRRACIVVSADHGGVPVPAEERIVLSGSDPLLQLLRVPPSGEPRVRFFHVREGCEAEFERGFRGRFGDAWALLTVGEVQAMQLFGPEPMTPEAARRYGDYCGIALNLGFMVIDPSKELLAMKGTHGGLQPDEMRIPLIVA